MSPATRASRIPAASFPAVDRVESRPSKLRRASAVALNTANLDLAAKLRVLQRTLRSRVDDRDALLEIVRAVNSTLDPAAIADAILHRAAEWLLAPHWTLVSADPSGQLSVVADRGPLADMTTAAMIVGGWVIRRGEDFAAADVSTDDRVSIPFAGAVIAFPLTCRGRSVGALVGFDRAPSSREPRVAPAVVRGVRLLLEPAAAALDTALQLQRAEALSVTDDLTHLYNSRYLNVVLRRETKRASRSGRPLSLLFIDLDGFKSVNDTHGHLCGSAALVEAAAVIRGSARETDVTARFGGDEFALVLPDTGAPGAFAVGARIRDRIAAHKFLSAEGLDVRLTASVGVATLPDAAASAEELLHAADTAMYQVKDAGKNGIRSAAPPAERT